MTAVTRGSSDDAPVATSGGRIGVFDLVRGLSVISMVLFHLCYDLRFIAQLGSPMDWFAPPLQDVWRCSISWTFLFVAGCMCPLSRSNLRRAAQYGLVALAIWVVTSIASVDTPISFGIIYCMASCTLVAWALGRVGLLPRGPLAALVLLVAFLALQGLSDGVVGFGAFSLELPGELYATPWLSSSGDYYPLLPYLALYLCGAAMGAWWSGRGYPEWARRASVAPLNFVGRHALAVYVIHQPVLLALCALVG